ncbi:MAG: polyamine transporter ATP-binding protein [Rhizobium sp.]|nr:polyamine transporter ATP-binding protein [Rhizobium sp.]
MASVEVRNLSRTFGAHKALDDVSVRFEDGGFYALLGPSGSGKTTLLRMIAGFDYPDRGQIEMDGESVERVPLEKRQIGMVFQNYALFPNMSVAQNVAFGLDVRGVKRDEMARKVDAALDLVQLGKLGSRRPHQLSGGQRQRVALARAFVFNPRVLLLDEPLGALDKALRVDMQVELKRIQREIGITTIFVTHDQEEALTMSDRIGILKDGRLIEEGRPEEIYNRPRTLFAATFLGDANILSGIWNGEAMVLADGTLIRIGDVDGLSTGGKVQCAIRPERIRILADGVAASDNKVRGKITRRMFAGVSSTVFVDCLGMTMRVVVPNAGMELLRDGEEISLTWSKESTIPVRDSR